MCFGGGSHCGLNTIHRVWLESIHETSIWNATEKECWGGDMCSIFLQHISVLTLPLIYDRSISPTELMRHQNLTFAQTCILDFFQRKFFLMEIFSNAKNFSHTHAGAKFMTLSKIATWILNGVFNQSAFCIHWMHRNSMQFVKWNPISLSFIQWYTFNTPSPYLACSAKEVESNIIQCDWSCLQFMLAFACVCHKTKDERQKRHHRQNIKKSNSKKRNTHSQNGKTQTKWKKKIVTLRLIH